MLAGNFIVNIEKYIAVCAGIGISVGGGKSGPG